MQIYGTLSVFLGLCNGGFGHQPGRYKKFRRTGSLLSGYGLFESVLIRWTLYGRMFLMSFYLQFTTCYWWPFIKFQRYGSNATNTYVLYRWTFRNAEILKRKCIRCILNIRKCQIWKIVHFRRCAKAICKKMLSDDDVMSTLYVGKVLKNSLLNVDLVFC